MKSIAIIIVFICITTSCNTREARNFKTIKDNASIQKNYKQPNNYTVQIKDQHSKLTANRHYQINIDIDVNNIKDKLKDTCSLANRIRRIILYYLRDEHYDITINDQFIILSKENRSNMCSFPRNQEELNLLYLLTQKLLIKSETENSAIKLIFNLKKVFDNVVEYSEHVQFIIPQVALMNTSGFINVLSTCETSEQEKIIDKLQFFDNKNAIRTFRQNLSQIMNHKEIVSLIEKKLSDEFGN
jgi:hypothetical protein